jgi:hypothetical protein
LAPESALRPLSRGYHRDAWVEEEIVRLLRMPSAEQARRLTRPQDGEEPASPECMLYFIRERMKSGDAEEAWSAAEALAKRLARRITPRLAVLKIHSPNDREEVEEAQLTRH